MMLVARRDVPIGYPVPADLDDPDGPTLVVAYAEGQAVAEPVDNRQGLIDQEYVAEVDGDPRSIDDVIAALGFETD